MLGTRAEEIFENLKKFLSPVSIRQIVLVPQNNFFDWYPYHQVQNSSRSFRIPFTTLL